MSLESGTSERHTDNSNGQHDKPRVDRYEHANLERPGAKAHPLARGWSQAATPRADWRQR